MCAQLAFGGYRVHQFADDLPACDALPDFDLAECQTGIFADSFVSLADLYAPAPERVPRTGGHHAVAQAEDVFPGRGFDIQRGMSLPAGEGFPEHGLVGKAADDFARNGADGV